MFLTVVASAGMPKWQNFDILRCSLTILAEFLIPHTCSALSTTLKSITIQQSTSLSPLLNLTENFANAPNVIPQAYTRTQITSHFSQE